MYGTVLANLTQIWYGSGQSYTNMVRFWPTLRMCDRSARHLQCWSRLAKTVAVLADVRGECGLGKDGKSIRPA